MSKSTASKVRFRRNQKPKTTSSQPSVRPHAAGIDVGATALYVAVPNDCDPQPVRTFETFTEDLHALADWLVACKVETVALESTGVYWIPVFQILEERGIEVCLVNARHVKNVPGRKTDVMDCQWLQYLHSVGLLRASFRPPAQVCAVRSLMRHRDSLIRSASRCIQHMQKAFTEMNIRLANVISDLTGKTGLAIVDAILAGERDCDKLAALRDHRIKASLETIAKSLVGDWKPEHLFTLGHARQTYAHYQQLIAETGAQIAELLRGFESLADVAVHPLAGSKSTRRYRLASQEPGFDHRSELHRVLGVDLTQIPGVATNTVSVLLSEVGPSVARFATPKHFASWLGLCPDNRITGGRVLSASTREVKSRTAHALRLAAQTLYRSQSSLGDYFRRIKARLGPPAAITATAHKLARIIHHLLTHRCAYDESVFAKEEELQNQRHEKYLRKQAARRGFQLTPFPVNSI